MQVVEELTGYPREQIHLGIDGCGVPVHRLPLANCAWAFAKLAKPEVLASPVRQEAVRRIVEAMTLHPEMVGGENRYCTDLMSAFQGRVVGKAGAEAVYCLGDRKTGLGIAVKIEDGGARAVYPVVNEVLRQLGIGVGDALNELHAYTNPLIHNMSGTPVGRIEARFSLKQENVSLRS